MISAVICTANPRVDYFERAVEGILAQEFDSDGWEILVIDNASTSPVAMLPIVSQHGLRVVREERVGLTAAKERATREASGEVVVFVDDDNVLAADYLRTVAELFRDPHLGVVGPHIEAEYEVDPPHWFLHPRMESSVVIRRMPNEGSMSRLFQRPVSIFRMEPGAASGVASLLPILSRSRRRPSGGSPGYKIEWWRGLGHCSVRDI